MPDSTRVSYIVVRALLEQYYRAHQRLGFEQQGTQDNAQCVRTVHRYKKKKQQQRQAPWLELGELPCRTLWKQTRQNSAAIERQYRQKIQQHEDQIDQNPCRAHSD